MPTPLKFLIIVSHSEDKLSATWFCSPSFFLPWDATWAPYGVLLGSDDHEGITIVYSEQLHLGGCVSFAFYYIFGCWVDLLYAGDRTLPFLWIPFLFSNCLFFQDFLRLFPLFLNCAMHFEMQVTNYYLYFITGRCFCYHWKNAWKNGLLRLDWGTPVTNFQWMLGTPMSREKPVNIWSFFQLFLHLPV